MMKSISRFYIPVAALSMALVAPGFTYAQSEMNSQSSPDSSSASAQDQMQEAQQMVPARAYLLNKLNAKDMKPGAQFEARLSKAVQLKNGTELPKSTELIGVVSTDDMQLHGTSKLALRITEARLKDGTTLPLKATIVGVYAPESENDQGYAVAPGDEVANDWNTNTLTVDQPDAVSGVDMHSRIDAENSGTFVSTKKDNVKIASGSELALALAAQDSGSRDSSSGSN
jgi:predicted RecA/RadA family phage recombinase